MDNYLTTLLLLILLSLTLIYFTENDKYEHLDPQTSNALSNEAI